MVNEVIATDVGQNKVLLWYGQMSSSLAPKAHFLR